MVSDGFSCILDFQNFMGGGPPDPLEVRIHEVKPSFDTFSS